MVRDRRGSCCLVDGGVVMGRYEDPLREIESLRQQLAEASHAHEFMSQQYLDVLKERNQLRKDVAKLQDALHCKLTWKPT